jgi:hypothetical protein
LRQCGAKTDRAKTYGAKTYGAKTQRNRRCRDQRDHGKAEKAGQIHSVFSMAVISGRASPRYPGFTSAKRVTKHWYSNTQGPFSSHDRYFIAVPAWRLTGSDRNRTDALIFCFDAFSLREPVPLRLKTLGAGPTQFSRTGQSAVIRHIRQA